MDISTLANLINAIAVTAGVIFAATQIRDYRRQRKRDSMLSLVRSFQNPTFAKALRRVVHLPDNASAEEIRKILGPEGEDLIVHVTATWVWHNGAIPKIRGTRESNQPHLSVTNQTAP